MQLLHRHSLFMAHLESDQAREPHHTAGGHGLPPSLPLPKFMPCLASLSGNRLTERDLESRWRIGQGLRMIERILAKRIVPVIVLDDVEQAEPLADALLAGGLDIMEITFRTTAAAACIERIARNRPEILVGAGTLLQPDQVVRAREAGAKFGLAPGLNPEVVAKAAKLGLPFSPGVMTPSEVEQALGAGCKLLKFFPAGTAGGSKMLQALAGPYGHTGVHFIPTGGINRENMLEYLAVPVVAAIGGSWMVDRKLILAGAWDEITRLTREALDAAAATA